MDEKSGYVDIEKRIRQGYIPTADLFSLYTQLMKNELAKLDGVKIGERNVKTLGMLMIWSSLRTRRRSCTVWLAGFVKNAERRRV